MSFGIGGHINPVDDAKDILDSGLKRELSEELDTDNPPAFHELELVGLICSDANEVSKVHLGLVLLWNVSVPVSIRETDKMHGSYLTIDEIGENRDRLENWSRLVYDGFLSPIERSVPIDSV
jgi:predicted NUDIX family phosphoesterase